MNETLSKEEVEALIKGVILADEENGIFLKCKKCGVKHSINEECSLDSLLWGDMFEEQGITTKKKLDAALIKDEVKPEDFICKETGWICPTCGRGNAPFVRRCNCK